MCNWWNLRTAFDYFLKIEYVLDTIKIQLEYLWNKKICLFILLSNTLFFSAVAAAAAAAQAQKEKSWTLGNGGQRKKSGSNREKQMPMRPRSVNSTFEKSSRNAMGPNASKGYATLSNLDHHRTNRSFHDSTNGGNVVYARYSPLHFMTKKTLYFFSFLLVHF